MAVEDCKHAMVQAMNMSILELAGKKYRVLVVVEEVIKLTKG